MFSTTNPTWSGLGLNLDLHGGRMTTNCLNHDSLVPKKKSEHNPRAHMLFINIHKAYDLVKREELYIILLQSSSRMELVRLYKMC
jgi:hypothetical protein